jgi:hypothetical protein
MFAKVARLGCARGRKMLDEPEIIGTKINKKKFEERFAFLHQTKNEPKIIIKPNEPKSMHDLFRLEEKCVSPPFLPCIGFDCRQCSVAKGLIESQQMIRNDNRTQDLSAKLKEMTDSFEKVSIERNVLSNLIEIKRKE